MLILFLTAAGLSAAQQVRTGLQSGSCCVYRGNLFAFGMAADGKGCSLKIFRLDKNLGYSDSLTVKLPSQACNEYVSPYSDTLHGFLNIYLHRRDKSGVTLLRLTDSLKIVTLQLNVEPGRLLDRQSAGRRTLCRGNDLYRIRIITDSSGKQFYLNKERLETATNDYSPVWQFAFERKHVEQAFPFFADSRHVYLFAVVGEGPKAGEWVLKCDAGKGTLVRACKLNAKGEPDRYAFGGFMFDSLKRELLLTGQKLREKATVAPQRPEVYALAIDSNFNVGLRQLSTYSFTTGKSPKKPTGDLLLKFGEVTRQGDALLAECDLFEGTAASCYFYKGTHFLQVPLNESKPGTGTIYTSTVISGFLTSPDPADINGKLCGDSASCLQVMLVDDPPLRVKLASKITGNAQSDLLTRSDIRKKSIQYALVTGDRRLPKCEVLGSFRKESRPSLIVTGPDSYVICQDGENGELEIKAFSW